MMDLSETLKINGYNINFRKGGESEAHKPSILLLMTVKPLVFVHACRLCAISQLNLTLSKLCALLYKGLVDSSPSSSTYISLSILVLSYE